MRKPNTEIASANKPIVTAQDAIQDLQEKIDEMFTLEEQLIATRTELLGCLFEFKDNVPRENRDTISTSLSFIRTQIAQCRKMRAEVTNLRDALEKKYLSKYSNNFIHMLREFIIDPRSSTSLAFMSEFLKKIQAFSEIFHKQILTHNFILLEPTSFSRLLDSLTNLSLLLPILMEYELSQDAKNFLDIVCDRLLPDLTKAFTLFVEKEAKSKKKGVNIVLKPFSSYAFASTFFYIRAAYCVKIGDISAAESALERAQIFRDTPLLDTRSHQDTFGIILKNKFRDIYIDNQSEWKTAIAAIKELNDTNLGTGNDCLHYFVLAEIAVKAAQPDFAMAECYCDLGLDYFSKTKVNGKNLDKITSPIAAAKLLLIIADEHQKSNRINSATRCTYKALEFYTKQYELLFALYKSLNVSDTPDPYIDTVKRQVNEALTQVINTKKALAVLKSQAFEHFIVEWTQEETSAVVPVKFAKDNMTLTADFNDNALLKSWIRELQKLKLNSKFHFEVDARSVILRDFNYLSAKQINASFTCAQKSLLTDKVRIQRRREQQAAVPQITAPVVPTAEASNDYQSDASKDLYPAPTNRKPRKNPQQQQLVARPNAAPLVQIVDWSDDIPNYIDPANICPIPDPTVTNSSMPRGIFFAYIDHEQINNEAISPELLGEFQSVLERGKIAADGNSQGIRPVQGELGHDNDYIFKLNIHAEDYRLYGRRVAEQTLPNGKVIVLIAFDQALAHNKVLNLTSNTL